MTYAIAAAGTGGHVFPALAVAEALEHHGVSRSDILFFGGKRFEADAVPKAGYELVQLPLQGLQRSLSVENLRLPFVVWSALSQARQVMRDRSVKVLLGTGGYVTLPTGMAARWEKIPCFVAEQNAHAGLANKIVGRWARTAFTAFEETEGLDNGSWVGNPVRASIATARSLDRAEAVRSYGLDPGRGVIGVVGGSLGAQAINGAIENALRAGSLGELQVVHLAGSRFSNELGDPQFPQWVVRGFEDHMERFFAASDLVVSRAGGMVAEITATGTPSILIPGNFGSKGHQDASAEILARQGAATILLESELDELGSSIRSMIGDTVALDRMAAAAAVSGKPDAASTIAKEMIRAHV